jgi:two-component system response regulator HydG
MTDNTQPLILVVDDDPGHLTTLRTLIQSWNYRVQTAADGRQAVDQARQHAFDLILMDVRMAGMGGIEALRQIQAYNPAIPILIMTAYSSVQSAVEALKAGAYDYLTKPLDFDLLKHTLQRAREHLNTQRENRQLKQRLQAGFEMGNIIGKSPVMKNMIEMLAMVAPSEATVLIQGESGTGKELIARSIHYNSRRKDAPFVTVNCAAITDTLLESELFGHERGAFTGADKRREGRFMQANKGSIFLDEIGETSATMQVKLLRVIQEREIQRVGGEQVLKVDLRILAATNRDLQQAVAAGTFREDLFYRLNVVAVNVPPLRDRADDVPLLAQYFLERYSEKNRKPVKGFSPGAMDRMLRYPWPGNVRELENAVERAVILLIGDFITERELPMSITGALPGPSAPAVDPRPLEQIEKEAIFSALDACGGNKSEAARQLGINRKTLHNKLKLYGVND